MKDPVGPGQGNQLPYLDAVRWLIIPDISTRLAALRTGKIDRMYGINWEDAALMDKTTPELLKAETGQSAISPVYMRTDKAPFSDIRVRRAMMMGIDFETVSAGMYNSLGNIITWPYNAPAPHAYSGLYLGLDDPDMPESIKELYTYNPDKAKQLLSEAGYPDGFRAELVLTATNVDYYSIYKDMWSKVGIELVLDVKESGAFASINQDRAYESLITSATGPPSIWPMLIVMTGEGWQNQSYLDDPVINDAAAEIGKLAITDPVEAMGLTRELMKHVLDQAYVIPNPSFPSFLYWWPWLKNYSGERSIGYFWVESWPQWVWLDQDMKASMGY
jgi:peptide/nickel transport system substrate-binding protein